MGGPDPDLVSNRGPSIPRTDVNIIMSQAPSSSGNSYSYASSCSAIRSTPSIYPLWVAPKNSITWSPILELTNDDATNRMIYLIHLFDLFYKNAVNFRRRNLPVCKERSSTSDPTHSTIRPEQWRRGSDGGDLQPDREVLVGRTGYPARLPLPQGFHQTDQQVWCSNIYNIWWVWKRERERERERERGRERKWANERERVWLLHHMWWWYAICDISRSFLIYIVQARREGRWAGGDKCPGARRLLGAR